MEIKILQVFYDKNGLPYKDKERTVHYPITSGTFLGASNTTQIMFYYDQLDELNESTFVAVSKLPNGRIGSEILESEYDSELEENYAVLNLSQFYTQYKGDVYISLQGYEGGVRVEQDEDGIYSIIGTPTIQATGSIRMCVAYAPTFIGSGQTENVTLQRVLAELSTKLGIRQETLHVEELPTVGNPNVWYVVNDDPNDTTKANIYIWNAKTQTYVWVGDNTLNLGDYYTQEQGEQFEQDVRETIGDGSPKGVYATLSDLETAYPTGTNGIYVVAANGHWYYWNGSAWADGGVYLSTSNAISQNEGYSNFVTYKRIPETISFLQGSVPTGTTAANRITVNGLKKIIKGIEIKAQSGYEFCLYDSASALLTGNWVSNYTLSETQDCYVVFRKSDNSNLSALLEDINDILENPDVLYKCEIDEWFDKTNETKEWAKDNFVSYFNANKEFVFAQGNRGSTEGNVVSQNRITLLNAVDLEQGTKLVANNGFQFAIYSYIFAGTSVSGGWVTEYTLLQDLKNAILAFRKDDDSNMSPDDYELGDLIENVEVLLPKQIEEKFAKDLVKSKELDYNSSYFVQGNKGTNTSDTNTGRITLTVKLPYFAGKSITTKDGFLLGVYTDFGGTLLTTGWVNGFEAQQNYSSLVFVFRKTDDTAISPSDYSLSDLVGDLSQIVSKREIGEEFLLDYSQLLNTPNSKWYGKTATFMGDSITAGVGATSGQLYWNKLKDKLDLASVIGMGVGGSCLSVTSNYGTSNSPISTRWNTIPDTDLIVIFAGTNDYGHDTPMGNIDDATDISFYGALNVIIKGLMGAHPSKRIAFMTPLHRYNFGGLTYDYNANGAGNTLKDYVDAIKLACERYGIPVIDTFSISGLNPLISEIKNNYMPDGLHPNDDGHNFIAERTAGLFNNL